MARWAKPQHSGSNFEVTSITASDFRIVANNVIAPITFVSPEGYFQSTSSLSHRPTSSIHPFKGYTTLEHVVDTGYKTTPSYSITIPDLPISVSSITNSIVPDPTLNIISNSILFRDSDGALEMSSSYFIEPVLSFIGSQSAINNSQIKSGSLVEGPDPVVTASFLTLPLINAGGRSDPSQHIAVTFNSRRLPEPSIFFTHSAVNYVNWSNPDYIEFRRAVPPGFAITCSYNIPVLYNGNLSFPQGKRYVISLTHWEQYDESDQSNVVTYYNLHYVSESVGNFFGSGIRSGSISGSFNIESTTFTPITPGTKFQLRMAQEQATGAGVGYGYLLSASADQPPMVFEIEDQTGGSLSANIILGGQTSGSFIGSQFGDYSGSLSGVTLNSHPTDKALLRGNGLLFQKTGSPGFSSWWKGDELITASVRLWNAQVNGVMTNASNYSGLTFDGYNDSTIVSGNFDTFYPQELVLTESLAQNGLYWPNFDTSKLSLKLDGLNNGSSGLKITANEIAISDNLDGQGLAQTVPGELKLSLAVGAVVSGLEVSGDELSLSSSLPGNGLFFPNVNSREEIELAFSQVVSPDKSLEISSSAPSIFIASNAGLSYDALLSYTGSTSNPSYAIFFYAPSAHPTLSSISGSSIIISGSGTHSIGNSLLDTIYIQHDSVNIQDQFIILNAGNNGASPYSKDRGGIVVQTNSNKTGSVLFYDLAFQSGFNLFDSRQISRGGWLLTTASSYAYESPAYNPWDLTDSNSNPTSSFNSLGTNHVQTVKPLNYFDPNNSSVNQEDAVYQTGSFVQYGAITINTGSTGDPNDSNVWIYVTG